MGHCGKGKRTFQVEQRFRSLQFLVQSSLSSHLNKGVFIFDSFSRSQADEMKLFDLIEQAVDREQTSLAHTLKDFKKSEHQKQSTQILDACTRLLNNLYQLEVRVVHKSKKKEAQQQLQ